MKNLLLTLFKISLAVGLITYLMQSGQLDFAAIGKVLTVPSLGVSYLLFWLIFQVFLGAYRWRLLLLSSRYEISLGRAIKLQMMGFFFNTAMPGAVGGDLVKVMYVIKENRELGKAPAMLSIFIDRLIGLSGLFTIGVVTALINFDRLSQSPILMTTFIILTATLAGLLLFFFAALYHYKGEDPFAKLFSRELPGFSVLLKVYQSIRSYQDDRSTILKCYLVSVAIQLAALVLFYLSAVILLGQQAIVFSQVALVFPIGIFTMALPIAPGGLGVGHVAFDRLLQMIGVDGGATVANVYILTLLLLNLVGVFPYLAHKKRQPDAAASLQKLTDPT